MGGVGCLVGGDLKAGFAREGRRRGKDGIGYPLIKPDFDYFAVEIIFLKNEEDQEITMQ